MRVVRAAAPVDAEENPLKINAGDFFAEKSGPAETGHPVAGPADAGAVHPEGPAANMLDFSRRRRYLYSRRCVMDPVTVAIVASILVSGGVAAWKLWKGKKKGDAIETIAKAAAEAAKAAAEAKKKGK